jgi:hypothetical protein
MAARFKRTILPLESSATNAVIGGHWLVSASTAGPPTKSRSACHRGDSSGAPIADVLTHVGQLAMLRRLSGALVRGENYSRAEIEVGRVGAVHAAPKREVD